MIEQLRRRAPALGACIAMTVAWSSYAQESPHAGKPAARSPIAEMKAEIVLVTSDAHARELAVLIAELLRARELPHSLTRAARFDADALFSSPSDSSARVFIRYLPGDDAVRLYFRGPSGERFLLRKLPAPHGLDEVGRELVAQVVESSLRTLLTSSGGLSRAEASAAVAADLPRESEPRAPAAAPESMPAKQGTAMGEAAEPRAEQVGSNPSADSKREAALEPRASLAQRATRLPRAWAGLRYVIAYSGKDLGLAHGPGLELGLTVFRPLALRARLSAERRFSQLLQTPLFDARVQSTLFVAQIEFGMELPWGRLLPAVGGGVAVVRIAPEAAREAVTLAASRLDVVPELRPELRYELQLGRVMLSWAAFLELSLLRTHYDLVDAGVQRREGAPWLARPGANFGVGWSW